MTNDFPLDLPDQEWRKRLNELEYHVLRESGTEAPFTGEYTDTVAEGVYECRACGTELFRSEAKFSSHCGWPSVEVRCAACNSHLGHVFRGEGYDTPTDERYCINSICLRLVPARHQTSPGEDT